MALVQLSRRSYAAVTVKKRMKIFANMSTTKNGVLMSEFISARCHSPELQYKLCRMRSTPVCQAFNSCQDFLARIWDTYVMPRKLKTFLNGFNELKGLSVGLMRAVSRQEFIHVQPLKSPT